MVAKIVTALLTVIIGVSGAYVLYYVMNRFSELLPRGWEDRVKPYLYVLPAFLAVGIYLLYPTVQTLFYSLANADSTGFVGFKNYTSLFASTEFRSTLLNTLLWLIIAPAVTILLGLAVATLADRLGARGEKFAKTVIFLPLAIGAVGAATIWKFVFTRSPAGQAQIGLQNAVWTKLGGSPVAWLQTQSWHFNSLELMIMFLWTQIGFSMVLISAAIKSVPMETLEAARIDGANEWQTFRRVVVPQIRPTIITVFVTVMITVLKLFDIIYVMTDGQFDTNVIGVQFYNELFTNQDDGRAAAIVVILIVAVVPVMIYQVRNFRMQEANR